MPFFQFIGAAIGVGAMLSLTSLIWPRVTSDPRPPALSKVRDAVLTTGAGQQAAQVLGVTDESQVERLDVATLVTRGAESVLNSVTETVRHNATAKLMESLATQFETLPEDEKEAFRARICKPASPSAERR